MRASHDGNSVLFRPPGREELIVRALLLLNSPSANGDSMRDLVSLIGEQTGVDAVGIRLRDGEDFPYHETQGFPDGFVASEKSLCRRGADGRLERDRDGCPVLECMCGAVIRGRVPRDCVSSGGTFWTNSTSELLGSKRAIGLPAHMRNRCLEEGFESMALVPLRDRAETIGLLQLNDRRSALFDREAIAFLEGLCAGLGPALSGRLGCDAGRARWAMRVQRDLAVALGEASDLGAALEQCLDTAIEATAFDCGGIYLPDEATGGLRMVCSRNLGEEFLREITFVETGAPQFDCVARGEPTYRVADEFETPSRVARLREAVRCGAALPVSHEGRIVACLNLGSHEHEHVSAADRLVAESIAVQMGGIISRIEAAESLRESEARYRATIEATTDMMHVVNRQLEIELCNGAFRQALAGVGQDADPVGAALFTICPFLTDEVRDQYAAVFEGREELNSEERTVIAGQDIWTETRKIPILDERGEVDRVLTIIRNVTERKRDELRLRVQRDLAQALSEVTELDDALTRCVGTALEATVFDCGGVYLVDEHMGEMNLVYSRGLGEGFIESARHYGASSAQAALVQAGEPVYRDHLSLGVKVDEIRAAEGLRVMGIIPVTHEDRVVACMNLASRDSDEVPITDRLVAESIAAQMGSIMARLGAVDSLRRSEQREGFYTSGLALLARSAIGFLELPHRADVYEYIAEQIAELVVDSPIVVASYSAGTRLFAVRSVRNVDPQLGALRMLVGRDLRGVEFQLDDEIGEHLASGGLIKISRQAFPAKRGPVSRATVEAIRSKLGVRELRAIGFARGGELFGAVGFIVRAGDAPIDPRLVEAFAGQASVALGRRRSEEDKLMLEEQLSHAHKMEAIGTLAAGVAHDFNNLLTGVLGHAYMLKGRHEPGTAVFKSAETIETAALRASELTKQLLGFARRGKRQSVQVDVQQLIDDVIYFLEHTIDKRICLVRDTSSLPLFVRGDPSQLQAVILNLAVNARDAMPDGGELRFTAEPAHIEAPQQDDEEFVPGRYLRLTVRDTGEGIPEDIRDRIFEPFFTTKEVGKGTGMGLAMVYGVVRDHGGWIDVESLPGEGTRFEIYLPICATKDVIPTSTGKGDEPTEGQGCVLVVDDEFPLRRVFRRLLHRLGYEAICVENGEQAVEAYRDRGDEIDCVLLDLVMPVMNGSTCYRVLRRLDPGVKVILATGNIADETIQDLMREGVAACIEKPVMLTQLSRILADVIGRPATVEDPDGQER